MIFFIVQIVTKNTLEKYFEYIAYIYVVVLLIFARKDLRGNKIVRIFAISLLALKIYVIFVS